MHTPRRPRVLTALLGGMIVLVAATGCSSSTTTASGSSSTAASSTTTPGKPSTTSAAGATTTASSTGNGSSTTTAGPGGSVSIPITTTTYQGTPIVTVQVSVGGGQPVTVQLDTGSAGLVIDQSAIGPDATSTGSPDESSYLGVTVFSNVVTASLTMGNVTTPQPIQIASAQKACTNSNGVTSSDCPASAMSAIFHGTQGVLGIGLSDGPTQTPGPFSPLLQLGGPATQGWTVNAPSSGAGSLVLGPVTVGPGSTTTPMQPTPAPTTYPNGAPSFGKDAQLCWTVGSASGCGLTDFDLGAGSPLLTATSLPGVPSQSVSGGSIVSSGTNIAVATTSGGSPFWQFQASTEGTTQAALTSLPGTTLFNTGIGFFFANSLGYDLAHSQFVITPQ